MKRGTKPHSLRLTYDAELLDSETGDSVTDVALLEQLDGVMDASNLADAATEDDFSSGIRIVSARPTLRFREQTGRLILEICFYTDLEPTPSDAEQISSFSSQLIEGGWGLNHMFDMPASFPEELTVYFGSEPREPTPAAGSAIMAELIKPWKGWDFVTLEARSNQELEALAAQLKPHAVRDYTAEGVQREVWNLYEAVGAQLQRRAADAAGGPRIDPLDDLDKLDDLPDDVF